MLPIALQSAEESQKLPIATKTLSVQFAIAPTISTKQKQNRPHATIADPAETTETAVQSPPSILNGAIGAPAVPKLI
jgi:hypothetical protein